MESAAPGSNSVTRLAAAAQASVAPDYSTVVQQLYVAYFGRPADSTGLANFAAYLSNAGAPADIQALNTAYRENATVRALIDAFGNSDESKALYTGNTDSFVKAIYQNVLGRAPDQRGLEFWVDAIDNQGLTRGNASFSIMAGALANKTPEGLADAALIQKRITIAGNFTASITTPILAAAYEGDEAAAAARALLRGVTATTDAAAFQTQVDATLSALASTVVTVSGYATKGPMNGAKVTIHALNPDGSRGAVLGESSTAADNSGKFSVAIHAKPSGPIAVSVSSGTYTSAYSGQPIQSTAAMDAVVDSVPDGGISDVSVTPLSDMVAQRSAALAKQGATLSNALAQARNEIQSLYKLHSKPEGIVPSFDPGLVSTDRFAVGMILVSLESFAHTIGATDTDAVYATLSADFTDGALDGKAGSTALRYGSLINVTSATLKDKMFTDIRSSAVSMVNQLAPASLTSWVNINPATASAKAIASPPPGYSCSAGYTLVNDSTGRPICWDGTKAADGTPIIGAYTVCNGAIVAGTVNCTPAPTYSCLAGYQLVNDASGRPICWDGTRTSTGEIYLGSYYICGADNSKVAQSSQCKPSNTINMLMNSTAPAMMTAGTPGMSKSSTQIAVYTAPPIEQYQAPSIPMLTASDVKAISASNRDWSLPSWASLGSLNQAQLDAINQQTSLLTSFWAYH